jgi:hypothetical protein
VEKYTLDLFYATHFPLAEKYIALYPKSEIESQEVLDKRDRIREQMKEEMLHGKKMISGSNTIGLGIRARVDKDLNGQDLSEDEDMELNNESNLEENEEDDFLDLDHKKQ